MNFDGDRLQRDHTLGAANEYVWAQTHTNRHRCVGASVLRASILIEIDQDTLSLKAGVPVEIISLFEADLITQDARSVAASEHALEELGIEFLPEGR